MGSTTRLFGEVAFEEGFVTTAELYEALQEQARLEVAGGPHRFIGEILVELGHLDEPQVLQILNILHGDRQRRVREG